MVEVIAAFSALNAAFQGVKSVVNAGREVEDVFNQLTTWAKAVDDLNHWLGKEEKPSIWKKITFEKSATAEAFDKFAAKKKLQEMEAEIRHMFTWGELGHLGLDGYREFIQIRRDIKFERDRQVQEQINRRREFFDHLIEGSLIVMLISFSLGMLWWLVVLIVNRGAL